MKQQRSINGMRKAEKNTDISGIENYIFFSVESVIFLLHDKSSAVSLTCVIEARLSSISKEHKKKQLPQ